MEIVNITLGVSTQRRQMLDAMEDNTKKNYNFVNKVISTENVQVKSFSLKEGRRSKKKEANFFLFLVIALG